MDVAPFADFTIHLSLGSVTGIKYRTINCLECGEPVLEQSGDKILRLRQNSHPDEAHVSSDGTIPAMCSNCAQKYSLVIAARVVKSQVSLYMHPESLHLEATSRKKLRDTRCMECGKSFFSISDRVKLVSDNIVPMNMLDKVKMGPTEAWCRFYKCKQRWRVMV